MLTIQEFEILEITALLCNTDTNVVNGISTPLILAWIALFHRINTIVRESQLTSVPLGAQQQLQATWDISAVRDHRVRVTELVQKQQLQQGIKGTLLNVGAYKSQM